MSQSRTLALLATLTLLGACATTTESTTSAASPSSRAAKHETNAEYMARVEREAKRRNIGVTWIHPPTQRVEKDDKQH